MGVLLLVGACFGMQVEYDRMVDEVVVNGAFHKDVQSSLDSLELKTKKDAYIKSKYVKYDLEAIYKTGYFSSVTAFSLITNNRHVLSISVKENHSVRSIKVYNLGDFEEDLIVSEFEDLKEKPFNTVSIFEKKEHVVAFLK